MNLAEKIIAGTIGAVCLYLILSNPAGDNAVLNSLGSDYTSGVKALQGR